MYRRRATITHIKLKGTSPIPTPEELAAYIRNTEVKFRPILKMGKLFCLKLSIVNAFPWAELVTAPTNGSAG